MPRIERDIEVEAPLRQVYNQWTQFEEFPRFMEGVEEVQQLDDRRLYWHASIGGRDIEWEAEIEEQVPDRRIAWRSTSERVIAGAVEFEAPGSMTTNVRLAMEYEPEGIIEGIGDSLGVLERQVEGDLERFKEFIENRDSETGAWRGEIGSTAPQDRIRAEAERRQEMPGAGGAPGGQAPINEVTGEVTTPDDPLNRR